MESSNHPLKITGIRGIAVKQAGTSAAEPMRPSKIACLSEESMAEIGVSREAEEVVG